MDRSALKAGALAAMIGSLVAIVANLAHPRGAETQEAEARVVATSGIWLADHYLIALAALLSFFGLVAIARSFLEEPAASWARFAFSAAVVGTALTLATVFVDGMGNYLTSRQWARDPNPASLAAVTAVGAVSLGLFTSVMVTIFGITPVLFGVAGLTSRRYPRWLGILAIFAGLGGLLAGSIQFFIGAVPLTAFILFPISSVAFSIWILLMGLQLWKGLSGSAGSLRGMAPEHPAS